VLKTRLIPCLLLKDGALVRSEGFSIHQAIGYPLHEVERLSGWAVDELIYLDIGTAGERVVARRDHKVGELPTILDVLDAVAARCFVPLTFGGGIRTLEDMAVRFRRGADKIAINTAAFDHPDLVTAAAEMYGRQAVVVSIDAAQQADGSHHVVVERGQRNTGVEVTEWASRAAQLGAGEILLNSIDRDGRGNGYDLDLVRAVVDTVQVPVIALGGVGTYEHFVEGVTVAGASAVAAANIFHFKELSDRNAKRAMRRAGLHVRL
jgi:cyclase